MGSMVVEAGSESGIVRVKVGPHVIDRADFERITSLDLQHRSRKPFRIAGSISRPLIGKSIQSCIGTVAGDIAATRPAVGINEPVLDRGAVCSSGVHVHRGFQHTICALYDIHGPQVGLRVGIICWEDDVACGRLGEIHKASEYSDSPDECFESRPFHKLSK